MLSASVLDFTLRIALLAYMIGVGPFVSTLRPRPFKSLVLQTCIVLRMNLTNSK